MDFWIPTILTKVFFFLIKTLPKNLFILNFDGGLKVRSKIAKIHIFRERVLDHVLEQQMGPPYDLNSKRFVRSISILGKTNEKRTVVRVGPTKMSYRGFRKEMDLRIIHKEFIKAVKNKITLLYISLVIPSVFTTNKPKVS